MSKKWRQHYADSRGTLLEKPGIGILHAAGTTVPADASAGYAPGCIFQDTNASAGSTFYVNNGTATSSLFDAVSTTGGSFSFDDDALLGLGTGAPSSFSWETVDANANKLLLNFGTPGAVDVPVLMIGDAIESVDTALHNGVLATLVSLWGTGATATGPVIETRKARGTPTAPTVCTTGDDVLSIRGYAAVAAGEWVQTAEIRFDIAGTIATTRGPGNISLNVATDAAPSVLTERVLVTGSGQINVTPATDTTFANGTGVIVGHTAQVLCGAVTSELQMHGTAPADSTMLLAAWSADAVPPRLYFAKSRSATIGTFSIITTGDNLGEILAYGDDGVDFNSNSNASCGIIFDSTGTIAADRIAGVIRFQTATNAAPSVLTTALTIDADQSVTAAAGIIVTTGTAAAIAATRTLTKADSGGTFSVAKTGAYTITLPTAAAGLKFKFMVLDTGANIVTIAATSTHLYGGVSINNVHTQVNASTNIVLTSAGSIGDWVEVEGIDATHWLVTGSCKDAADISFS